MNDSDYHIKIPAGVGKYLKLKPGEKMNLKVEENGLLLERVNDKNDAGWNFSSLWSIIPAIIASIVFFVYFSANKLYEIRLTGHLSIATATILLGLATGAILFTIFLIKARRSSVNSIYRDIYWRNFPTIIVSVSAILLIVLLGMFWIFARVFMGASFGIYTATVIFLLFDLIINTFMINIAENITPTILVDLLAITIVGGLIVSMLANGNRQWWRHNISFLGTTKAIDNWQFNLTFIVAALLLVGLVDYLFVSIKPLHRPKIPTLVLRSLLTLLAISALGVGVMQNNHQIPWMHLFHYYFAWAMAFVIITLIIGIRWLWPGISPAFLRTSDLMGASLIIASILFKIVHYLSLTAYEIFGVAIAFAWILMLLQYILNDINRGTHQFVVKIESNKQNK